MPTHFIQRQYMILYVITLNDILFSTFLIYAILFYSILFYLIILYYIVLNDFTSYDILYHICNYNYIVAYIFHCRAVWSRGQGLHF